MKVQKKDAGITGALGMYMPIQKGRNKDAPDSLAVTHGFP